MIAAAEAYLPLSYAPSGCGRTTHLGALRVGVLAGDDWPMFNISARAGLDLSTYEGEVARELCTALCVPCEFVLLQDLGERIVKLQDGSLDVVLAAFSVTLERLEQVGAGGGRAVQDVRLGGHRVPGVSVVAAGGQQALAPPGYSH